MPNSTPRSPRQKSVRAEPLQPDLPGRGTRRQDADDAAGYSNTEQQRTRKAAEQSNTALSNVRKGYK